MAPENRVEDYVEGRRCPVCDTPKGIVKYRNILHVCNVLKKAGVPFTNTDIRSDVFECARCGHKYLNPMLKGNVLERYYGEINSEFYDPIASDPRNYHIDETRAFAGFIASRVPGGKALEIGCGLGHLLDELRVKGFDCAGVDASPFATKFAREQLGLRVMTGFLDPETFGKEKFDVVILNDVIEHLAGPNEMFAVITGYLKPGGRVIVCTGNSNSFYARLCGRKWWYFYSWEHISFFCKSSIRCLFEKHALRLTTFKRTRHAGSRMNNMKLLLRTFANIFLDLSGIRKCDYYCRYVVFDHFIAIGEKAE